MNAPSAEPDRRSSPEPRAANVKFAYTSGSRPLEGYTIKRGVGRGGFGEVYYATSDAGKEVALKLIRRNLDVEIRGVTQCLNLKHPNLVDLYDIRRDDQGDSWVVMEFVSGESLEDIIQANPRGLPPDEALAWFHGVAAGVAYLHDHGIVHRDLKPGNIFRDEGLVKIGDYGLSKFISASRRSGQTESVGTVHYMAPEIANGRYGKEIDIYALGVILYELLTGRVPFEGESVGEVLMKHLTAEPDLSLLNEPYRTAVGKALAKDPERRAQSVADIVAILPAPTRPMTHLQIPAQGLLSGASPLSPPPLEHLYRPQHAVNDDPVWRAVAGFLQRAWRGWENAPLNTAQRVLVGIPLAILIAFTIPVWFWAIIAYSVYLLFRVLYLAINGNTVPPAPLSSVSSVVDGQLHETLPVNPASAASRETPPASPSPRRWAPLSTTMAAQKSFREKLTELTGSMLMSATVVALATLLTPLIREKDTSPGLFAWVGLTSLAGAWCVLVLGKIWEGKRGEAILRRFVMLGAGMGLGFFAYVLGQFLMIDATFEWWVGRPGSGMLSRRFIQDLDFFGAHGEPGLWPNLAFFGFLFVVPAWWYQTDPRRSHRLGIFPTGIAIGWALLLSQFWPYPQPWGVIIAGAMSIAVQLSSPWSNPRRRGWRVNEQ